MPPWAYPKPGPYWGKLHAELQAAIPSLAPVPGPDGRLTNVYTLTGDNTTIWLTVPDSVAKTAVDAVLAATDPTTPSAADQQVTQDTTDLAALRAQYAADLAAIDADMTASGAARGQLNTSTWDALTAAQRTTGMKGLLDREQARLAREKRLLRALAILVRRLT